MTLLVNTQLVNTPLNPRFWMPGEEGETRTYTRTSRDVYKDRWLTNVPDEVALLVSPVLAPHLAHRYELHIARPTDGTAPPSIGKLLDKVDYVVLDGLLDYLEKGEGDVLVGNVAYDWEVLTAALHRPDFNLISSQDGLLLLQKRVADVTDVDWAAITLMQSVTSAPAATPTSTQAEFSGRVGLVEASIEHVRDRRYRLHYVWLAREGMPQETPLFAVTHFVEAEQARILHIPTVALYPTTAWTLGELVSETFEVEFPETISPGVYTLVVGWYDSAHTFAYATDARSRVGDIVPVAVLEVLFFQ